MQVGIKNRSDYKQDCARGSPIFRAIHSALPSGLGKTSINASDRVLPSVRLFGEDAGFLFGDSAVAVGVAAPHRLVEGDVFAIDHAVFMLEDHRDGDGGSAFIAIMTAL